MGTNLTVLWGGEFDASALVVESAASSILELLLLSMVVLSLSSAFEDFLVV
jgi:hypothetical protein